MTLHIRSFWQQNRWILLIYSNANKQNQRKRNWNLKLKKKSVSDPDKGICQHILLTKSYGFRGDACHNDRDLFVIYNYCKSINRSVKLLFLYADNTDAITSVC